MNTNIRKRAAGKAPVAMDAAMLEAVRIRLTRIHGSLAEATNDDKEAIPWTLGELMGLIREIRTFQQHEHPAES